MSRVNSGMELEGFDDLNAAFRKEAANAPELASDILELAAESLVSDAAIEAPKKTGILAQEHFVEMRRSKREAIVGANTNYAAAVHANHPTKAGWFQNVLLGKGLEAIKAAGVVVFRRREGTA